MSEHEHEDDLPGHIRDQLRAAARQADFWADVRTTRGARTREVTRDQLAPAMQRIVNRLQDGFERSVATGKMCPHKDPQRAQPTHTFAAQPDLRLCDDCAALVLAAMPVRCDGCGAPDNNLTAVAFQQHHLTFHLNVCDTCHPEGADAPRLKADP